MNNLYTNIDQLHTNIFAEVETKSIKGQLLKKYSISKFINAALEANTKMVPTKNGLLVDINIARSVCDTHFIDACSRELTSEDRPLIFNDIRGVFLALRDVGFDKHQLSRAQRKKLKQNSSNKQPSPNIMLNRLVNATTSTSMFLDVEWFEWSKGTITEIGYTIVDQHETTTTHIIIAEQYKKRNGKFVEDNKDNFNFGESLTMSLKQALHHLRRDIAKCNYIIGHGIKGDIDVIVKSRGEKHAAFIHTMFDKVIRVDTASLTKMISDRTLGIKSLLEYYHIDHSHLHNAGNDSYYNWLVAKNLYQQLSTSNIS